MPEVIGSSGSCPPALTHSPAVKASLASGLLSWSPSILGLASFASGFLNDDTQLFILLPAWACALFFCNTISIVLHELGHFVVGRVLGIPITQVVFGSREPFLEFSTGSVTWSFRVFPFGGMVIPGFVTKPSHWRDALTTAAGPMVDLSVALGCGWIIWAEQSFLEPLSTKGGAESFLLGMILVSTMGFLQSAIPRTYTFAGRTHQNDASIIAGIFRGKAQEETSASWHDIPVEERRAWLDGYRQCIGATEATAAEHRQWLEVFVTAVLMWGMSEHLGEAEEYSRRLLEFAPSDWTVQGIRGGVLVEIGRVDEGMALLETVMANSNDPHDRGIFACFVALGKKKSGDLADARRWAARAGEIYPNGPALPRIRDLLDLDQPGKPATSGERT